MSRPVSLLLFAVALATAATAACGGTPADRPTRIPGSPETTVEPTAGPGESATTPDASAPDAAE